jgi:hypothetical protein
MARKPFFAPTRPLLHPAQYFAASTHFMLRPCSLMRIFVQSVFPTTPNSFSQYQFMLHPYFRRIFRRNRFPFVLFVSPVDGFPRPAQQPVLVKDMVVVKIKLI